MSSFFSTGGVAFVVIISAVLTIPVSLGLVWLYQRSVSAAMARRTGAVETQPHDPAPTGLVVPAAALRLHEVERGASAPVEPAAAQALRRTLAGPWQAAVVYGVAGLVFALLTAILFLVAGHSTLLPLRLTVVTLTFAWPVVLTTNLLTAADRLTQARNVALYAIAILVLLGFNLGSAAGLWLITAGPPTVLLIAFLHPRVRTVGPLVFTFMTIGVLGANLLLLPLENTSVQRVAGGVSAATGLDVTTWIVLASVIGFAIAGLLGWATLSWLRGRYEAKQISDQSLSIDAIWLVFTVVNAVEVANDSAGLGFLTLGTFVVYRLLVSIGFRLLRDQVGVSENHRLLLLRVFGSAARSTRLMGQVGAHWRYVGSIELITGTDLATSTLEPHEFLEFVRGRLGRRHIRNRETLERHVEEMDLQADFDGRFRINQFLCYEDTWRATLGRLAGATDVVLMDLRGFSQVNHGVVFELEALINLVPLSRVVVIVDSTTDVPFLRGVLERAWTQMTPTSPNVQAEAGQLVMHRLESINDAAGVRTLLGCLTEAAARKNAPLTALGNVYVHTLNDV